MSIHPKKFAHRLTECLEEDYKPDEYERALATILADKYREFGIDKFSIQPLLKGTFMPKDNLVEYLADVFNVDPKWLSGEKDITPKPSR